MQKRESEGGGGRVRSHRMPCYVEHEGLVDVAEAMNFCLGYLSLFSGCSRTVTR